MSLDTSQAGRLGIQLTLGAALADNASHALVAVQASALTGAPVGSARLLKLQDLVVDGQPARTDNAVQLLATLGDANGDGQVNAADTVLVQRVAAGADTGFAAYPLIDPVNVSDLSHNVAQSVQDAKARGASKLLALRILAAPMPVAPEPVRSVSATIDIATLGTKTVPPVAAKTATSALPASVAVKPAPAPVVQVSRALDFGLNFGSTSPAAPREWVNDWVAGSRQSVPNDWSVTL